MRLILVALLEFISEVSMLRAFRKEVREGLKVLVPQMMLYMQMTDDNVCTHVCE